MIYRVFCSNFETEKQIRKVRNKECALDIRFTSRIKEIEANCFIEAAEIYWEKYQSECESLVNEFYKFFFLDDNGNILDGE